MISGKVNEIFIIIIVAETLNSVCHTVFLDLDYCAKINWTPLSSYVRDLITCKETWSQTA